MLTLPARVRVFVSVAAVDFRWGFERLCGRVRDFFGDDPLSGHWYVFFNRRRNRVKVLVWDANGFRLFQKRMERGCAFRKPVRPRRLCDVTRFHQIRP